MEPWFVVIGALIALAVVAVILSLKVIPEYERGVVFRLGRLQPLCGPGLKLVAPLFERLERVDQRVVTLTIPPQEVITRDNVPARVNAVVLFNVVDPVAAVMKVENYAVATSQIAQTTLRSVLGRADLDTILAHRDNLNSDLRDIIEHQTQPCGVDVSVVEIKDVEMPEQMRGRWPARPKPSGNTAPRSSTPAANCRRRRNCARRLTPCRDRPPRCSCGTCRPCWSWAPIRNPPWFPRSPWTSSAPCCDGSRRRQGQNRSRRRSPGSGRSSSTPAPAGALGA